MKLDTLLESIMILIQNKIIQKLLETELVDYQSGAVDTAITKLWIMNNPDNPHGQIAAMKTFVTTTWLLQQNTMESFASKKVCEVYNFQKCTH